MDRDGLIILFFYFMSSGAGISEKVSGDMNNIVNSEARELSVFHFTNLSNRLDQQADSQGHHNNLKYRLFAVIFGLIIFVAIFKCKNYRKTEKRRKRINENMELVEIHNESLATQGMLHQPITNKKRREIKKRKEEQEKDRKEQEKKESKKEKEKLKQEKKEEQEGKKQEKDQEKGQKMKWIQVPVELGGSGDDEFV